MTDAGFDVLTQDLLTSVNAGDTLSVTFYVGRDNLGGGVLQASFLVGATEYGQTINTTNQTVNTWRSYTLTNTIATGGSGNLSLKFSNVSGRAGWLDNVSDVRVTPSYTLTYTAGANGSISGTSPQTVASGGSGTAVTAVANTGYHFVNWSDSSTQNPRTDTSVSGNISVTANFAINTSAPTVSGITTDGLGKVILTGTSTGTGVVTEKSTNLAAQPIVWTPVSTNPVTAGVFSVTNSIGADPRAFFRVKNQ
jgi:hypothetical protein